ncbi:MAG: hypothetical protein WBX02_10025 [Terriglobales bacterium]
MAEEGIQVDAALDFYRWRLAGEILSETKDFLEWKEVGRDGEI